MVKIKFEKEKFEECLKELEKDENSEYFRVMTNMNDVMVDVAEAVGKEKYNQIVDVLEKYNEVLIKMVVEYMESKDN